MHQDIKILQLKINWNNLKAQVGWLVGVQRCFPHKFCHIAPVKSPDWLPLMTSGLETECDYSEKREAKQTSKQCTYTVSQKTSHLWLAIIFTYTAQLRQFLAQKVGNQNVLYFPTSPTKCFCTTWGNRKSRNCVFSLKCCMLFLPKNTKHS